MQNKKLWNKECAKCKTTKGQNNECEKNYGTIILVQNSTVISETSTK